MNPEDLIPGKTYTVKFSDCCVGGSFTSVFAGFVPDEWDDEIMGFANGVTIQGDSLDIQECTT